MNDEELTRKIREEKPQAIPPCPEELQCRLKINQSKYVWIAGEPVLCTAFQYRETAFLKKYVIEHPNFAFFSSAFYYTSLPKISGGKIEVHVLYRYISGNSHDEDWEHHYYRVYGSRKFDDFLSTISEQDSEPFPFVSNYIENIKGVEDFRGEITGVYCTLGDIRFILMAGLYELELTVIGNNPEEYAAVIRVLTAEAPDESRDQQADPAKDEASQHTSPDTDSPNESDGSERKNGQTILSRMIRKLKRRFEG